MEIVPASADGLAHALDVLSKGGVVAHATETCYGLACDLSNPEAVAKLFRIKQRPESQPVSALFASIEDAKRYVEWNEKAEELAKQLPGPLTIILRMRADTPYALRPTPQAQNPTIGIRISPHLIARELVTRFGKPISTTSANVHRKPNPYSAEEISEQFKDASEKPDLILDSGKIPQTPPSRVVDCTSENNRILR